MILLDGVPDTVTICTNLMTTPDSFSATSRSRSCSRAADHLVRMPRASSLWGCGIQRGFIVGGVLFFTRRLRGPEISAATVSLTRGFRGRQPSRPFQAENTKQAALIGPKTICPPSIVVGQGKKAGHVVFSRTLGMDGLAGGEIELTGRNVGSLRDQTYQVHLNRRFNFVPSRAVLESIEHKIAVEFAIHTCEQIEVELCRDALAIIDRKSTRLNS